MERDIENKRKDEERKKKIVEDLKDKKEAKKAEREEDAKYLNTKPNQTP